MEALEQKADYVALKGAVYRRKALNPKRLKGVGAFATSLYIYSYLPYIAAYLGPTLPVVAACFAGLYGMSAFAESQIVNEIRMVQDGPHQGKLRINVGLSPLISKNIIVDVRDIQSVVQLHNDNIGEDGQDGNVVTVNNYIEEATGELVAEETAFSLPGDAFRDKTYMDWILSNKTNEESLTEDYQDLMHQRFIA